MVPVLGLVRNHLPKTTNTPTFHIFFLFLIGLMVAFLMYHPSQASIDGGTRLSDLHPPTARDLIQDEKN